MASNKQPVPIPGASADPLVPEMIAPLVHYLRHEKVILDSDRWSFMGSIPSA